MPGSTSRNLVAAVADEHVRFADAGARHVNAGAQRYVAGLMAVGVVDQFKVVQIQHGNTGGVGLVLERVLKVEAVVAAGQCIVVELGVVARDAVYQAVPRFSGSMRVSPSSFWISSMTQGTPSTSR